MRYSNSLTHYGVKGMKWGVRRAEKARKTQRQYVEEASKKASMFENYSKDLKKVLKTGRSDYADGQLTPNGRSVYSRELKKARQAGQEWLKTKNDLMSMDVNSVSARQIKKRYKQTKQFTFTPTYEAMKYTARQNRR